MAISMTQMGMSTMARLMYACMVRSLLVYVVIIQSLDPAVNHHDRLFEHSFYEVFGLVICTHHDKAHRLY